VPQLAITDIATRIFLIFSELLEFAIHDHVSLPYQHDFNKSKSNITNLVICLNFITFLVGSHRQSDAIYFHFSNASDLAPNIILLQRLSAFGLSGGYVNWFHSYITSGPHILNIIAF
jgi:hypothetical protein